MSTEDEVKSNYSYLTSKPAFLENKVYSKQRQCERVLAIIRKGADNLLQISQVSGIPQAIVSARMSDLIDEGKAEYNGHVVYNNRLRKRIVVIEPIIEQPKDLIQRELF